MLIWSCSNDRADKAFPKRAVFFSCQDRTKDNSNSNHSNKTEKINIIKIVIKPKTRVTAMEAVIVNIDNSIS